MALSRCQTKDIFCWCVILLILATLLVPFSSAQSMEANRKRRPFKFMRWGKRFFDDTDVLGVDSSEDVRFERQQLPSELLLPMFGDKEILCEKVSEGGLYQCSQYTTTRSDTLRHK